MKKKKKKLSEMISIKSDKYPDDQKFIIEHMVMESEVLDYVYKKHKAKQIKSTYFSREHSILYRWLIRYYGQNKRAPKGYIERIFEQEKKGLGEDISDLTASVLQALYDHYFYKEPNVEQEDIDIDDIINDYIPRFIKKKWSEKLREEINKIDDDDPKSNDLISSINQKYEKHKFTEGETLGLDISIDDILQGLPDKNQWLIPRVICKYFLHIFAGDGGSLKTTALIKFADIILVTIQRNLQ